jgi:uncharacterized membrane protein YfcA
MSLPFDLASGQAGFLALSFLIAAFVRGYSGFGFAALVISSAALVTNPLHFVPVVLLADLIMSAQQWASIRRDVDWHRVAMLFAGSALGVPLGLWALTSIPEDAARATIALYVLAMCALLASGWSIRHRATTPETFGTGLLSGAANGAGVGGLPVAALFAAQALPAVVFRATLIAYFTLLDLWTVPLMWARGMVTGDTILAVALTLPIFALGIWLGGRRFLHADPQDFRRFAIGLLASLALLGLGKSLI